MSYIVGPIVVGASLGIIMIDYVYKSLKKEEITREDLQRKENNGKYLDIPDAKSFKEIRRNNAKKECNKLIIKELENPNNTSHIIKCHINDSDVTYYENKGYKVRKLNDGSYGIDKN